MVEQEDANLRDHRGIEAPFNSARMLGVHYLSSSCVGLVAEEAAGSRVMKTKDTPICPFASRCASYKDPSIDAVFKGPTGRGCAGRRDAYRARHCKTFRCMRLAKNIAAAFAEPIDSYAESDEYSCQPETSRLTVASGQAR